MGCNYEWMGILNEFNGIRRTTARDDGANEPDEPDEPDEQPQDATHHGWPFNANGNDHAAKYARSYG